MKYYSFTCYRHSHLKFGDWILWGEKILEKPSGDFPGSRPNKSWKESKCSIPDRLPSSALKAPSCLSWLSTSSFCPLWFCLDFGGRGGALPSLVGKKHFSLRLGFIAGGFCCLHSMLVLLAVSPLGILASGWLNLLAIFLTFPEFCEAAPSTDKVLLDGLTGTGGLCLTSGRFWDSWEDILIGFDVLTKATWPIWGQAAGSTEGLQSSTCSNK